MQKVTPFIWFDHQAEEAVNFYISVFKDAKITDMRRYGEGTPGEPGTVMTASFSIGDYEITALNGGPHFSITPGISFFVSCDTQEEVDAYWDKLVDGGQPMQCGWVTDKFGVTWQIVPKILGELMGDPDREKANRVVQAMMQMVKLDIAGLKRAYEQA